MPQAKEVIVWSVAILATIFIVWLIAYDSQEKEAQCDKTYSKVFESTHADGEFKRFWHEPNLKRVVICDDMSIYWEVNDTWVRKQ